MCSTCISCCCASVCECVCVCVFSALVTCKCCSICHVINKARHREGGRPMECFDSRGHNGLVSLREDSNHFLQISKLRWGSSGQNCPKYINLSFGMISPCKIIYTVRKSYLDPWHPASDHRQVKRAGWWKRLCFPSARTDAMQPWYQQTPDVHTQYLEIWRKGALKK